MFTCVLFVYFNLVLATSGIDYDIKLWEPLASEVGTLDDLADIVDRNEIMLQESRNTITVPSSFIIRVLTYLNRRRRGTCNIVIY